MSNQTAQNIFFCLNAPTLVSTMIWRTPSSALVHANRDTLDENRCATEFIVSILAPNRRVGVYNDGENHFQCGRDGFEFDAQCNGNSRKWYALSFGGLCLCCVWSGDGLYWKRWNRMLPANNRCPFANFPKLESIPAMTSSVSSDERREMYSTTVRWFGLHVHVHTPYYMHPYFSNFFFSRDALTHRHASSISVIFYTFSLCRKKATTTKRK